MVGVLGVGIVLVLVLVLQRGLSACWWWLLWERAQGRGRAAGLIPHGHI